MKKFFLTMLVLCCAVVAKAQNEAITAVLQHGDDVSVFASMDAFIQAHEAAADGDVITLSAGVFNAPTISKSLSVYGAGFEKDESAGTDVTMIKGNLTVKPAGAEIQTLRLEGLYVNASILVGKADAVVKNMTITKCYVNGDIRFDGETALTEISKCVINGNVNGNRKNAEGLLICNCHLGTVNGFSAASQVQVDHCIVLADYGGANLWTNSLLVNGYVSSSALAEGSVIYNCVAVGNIPANRVVVNCYVVPLKDIFADGENANYGAERTFELKQPETWLGTDGTQVGLHGGKGWSKVPGTPVVKNMKVEVEGMTLKVNYDAEVR